MNSRSVRSRNILLVSVLALAAGSFWYGMHSYRASASEAIPSLIDLAPPDATVIAYADVETLRKSALVQQFAAFAQPTQVDREYADFVEGTGFDYQRDLDRVLITTTGNSPTTRTVVIAEGRFDHYKIEKYAMMVGK